MGCNIQIIITAFNRSLNSVDRYICDTDFRYLMQNFFGGGGARLFGEVCVFE